MFLFQYRRQNKADRWVKIFRQGWLHRRVGIYRRKKILTGYLLRSFPPWGPPHRYKEHFYCQWRKKQKQEGFISFSNMRRSAWSCISRPENKCRKLKFNMIDEVYSSTCTFSCQFFVAKCCYLCIFYGKFVFLANFRYRILSKISIFIFLEIF